MVTSCGGDVIEYGGENRRASLEQDAWRVERDRRCDVFLTFTALSDYVRRCFVEYGPSSGEAYSYTATYKPYHLARLELEVFIAKITTRAERTGRAPGFRADVIAIVERDLAAGEMLDGEGGHTNCGKPTPAPRSLLLCLLIGAASDAGPSNPVAAGQASRWIEVGVDISNPALHIRRDMEATVRQDFRLS